MISLLLVIIYLAFISLGLPDSLIGSAWPVMHIDLGVSSSLAGIVTMIISCGTIVSSLLSSKLTKKLGTGLLTSCSVALTALALFGFSISDSFVVICLFAIPYGLGAGAIDATLNNYVSLHYSSRQLNWLHCFWGLGAIISPYIMSYALSTSHGWSMGYMSVSIIQIALTAVLFITLPLWNKVKTKNAVENEYVNDNSLKDVLKIKGVKYILVAFFAYCSLESTIILWASSYLHSVKAITQKDAAAFASLFFIGITAGRFLSGTISNKLGDKKLIRLGILILLIGALCVILPFKTSIVSIIGFVILGLGCAPVYPCIIHSTPYNFGKENSQSIIGVQMASAYIGSTLAPLVFGFVAKGLGLGFLPYYVLIFAMLLICMSELLNKTIKAKKEHNK